jgi:hypothetical protein
VSPHDIALFLSGLIGVAAWAGHTPASKAFADDIQFAIRDAATSQKELAYEMGIAPEKFSRQLAGLEPLNAFRLWGMTPVDFRVCLVERQAMRLGATVVRQAHISELIARVEELTGQRRMVKAELPPQKEVSDGSETSSAGGSAVAPDRGGRVRGRAGHLQVAHTG